MADATPQGLHNTANAIQRTEVEGRTERTRGPAGYEVEGDSEASDLDLPGALAWS